MLYECVGLDWVVFYKDWYLVEEQCCDMFFFVFLVIKNKCNLFVMWVKISLDGRQVAYIINEIGKYQIYLYDIVKGILDCIFKGGFCNVFQVIDYNYFIIDWNFNGQEIVIFYEKRDVVYFCIYNVCIGKYIEELLFFEYQWVYSMFYVNFIIMVFLVIVRGYFDIFFYYINIRQI